MFLKSSPGEHGKVVIYKQNCGVIKFFNYDRDGSIRVSDIQ